ncbi:PAS domain-containing protein [Methylobacterium sp. E-045]|uniref:PAS domain-containing protein n=1 Tax=Methylobacterium sp. E-045 TaxID=2836575 RepID=UPI001FBA0425|nr:PAS domain-containing protein [Methylobacterium sp. E-045]MCJ2129542.1 PAS domain-containing protein [Methylobacterium sp. E-045]
MHGGALRSLWYDAPNTAQHSINVGRWRWNFVDNTHFWSPGLYPILGISEGIVRPDYALLFQLIHPDDCPRTMEPAFVRQSESVPPSTFRIVRPDSRICTVVSRVEVTATPDGRPVCAHGILVDISDHAMWARAEAEQRRRDRAIFESVRAFTSTTYAFPFTKFSEEWLDLVGVPETELLQDPGRPIVKEYGRKNGLQEMESSFSAKHITQVLRTLRLANGDTARYRMVLVPVLNDAGHIESWTNFVGPIHLKIRPAGRLLLGLEQRLESGHIRAARALLDWSMTDLSGASGVSLSTIRRLEGCITAVSVANRNQAIDALRRAGIVFSFIDESTIAVSRGAQRAG